MTGDHPRNTGPMLSSPRCGAKTRSGKPCMSPAVPGKRRFRMHGGAPGSGAPRGNQNALIGAAVRGAALSMASIPAAQGQEPVSPDLPGERARGLDGGVEHAREILQPERRFVLPAQSRRDEINSGRTQEFLASFGQIDRIFMQLIVVTVRLPILTPAPTCRCMFRFRSPSLAEALEVLPIIPRGGADLAIL
jgi:hypothetical protein